MCTRPVPFQHIYGSLHTYILLAFNCNCIALSCRCFALIAKHTRQVCLSLPALALLAVVSADQVHIAEPNMLIGEFQNQDIL